MSRIIRVSIILLLVGSYISSYGAENINKYPEHDKCLKKLRTLANKLEIFSLQSFLEYQLPLYWCKYYPKNFFPDSLKQKPNKNPKLLREKYPPYMNINKDFQLLWEKADVNYYIFLKYIESHSKYIDLNKAKLVLAKSNNPKDKFVYLLLLFLSYDSNNIETILSFKDDKTKIFVNASKMGKVINDGTYFNTAFNGCYVNYFSEIYHTLTIGSIANSLESAWSDLDHRPYIASKPLTPKQFQEEKLKAEKKRDAEFYKLYKNKKNTLPYFWFKFSRAKILSLTPSPNKTKLMELKKEIRKLPKLEQVFIFVSIRFSSCRGGNELLEKMGKILISDQEILKELKSLPLKTIEEFLIAPPKKIQSKISFDIFYCNSSYYNNFIKFIINHKKELWSDKEILDLVPKINNDSGIKNEFLQN